MPPWQSASVWAMSLLTRCFVCWKTVVWWRQSIISRKGTRVSVVVDRAVANTYVRVNALMDQVNTRMFYGEPFEVTVRDGLAREEELELLSGPGVVFVRQDVVEES